MTRCNWNRHAVAAVAALSMCSAAGVALASDHDDTPLLKSVGRHDARITDLFAFTRGPNLVLIVATNPAIPVGVSQYLFPDDLSISIFIDNHAHVDFSDPVAVATYGGTVRRPERIRERVVFTVTFVGGVAHLTTRGLECHEREHRAARMFTGLRDDPFIRGPRIGRDVAAVVIEVPLEDVAHEHHPLLVWAATKVPEVDGDIADLGGRALRSQFAENLALNDLHPSLHQSQLGIPPDVIILDPSRLIAFPNGRELADDVVDLVGDARVLGNDAPFPSQNDVPFLAAFPYLAPPHL
jgi:hypothetical protein